MSELQKITKYSLLIYAAGGFIFAFLYLVITEIYLINLSDWPYYDPYYPRAFGGTLLVLGLIALIGSFKKEWEHVKLTYELALAWLIMVLIMNIAELALLTPALSVTATGNTIFNTVIVVIFIIIGIYCYMKQRE